LQPGDRGNGKMSAYDASLVDRYSLGLTNLTEEQTTKDRITRNGSFSATDDSSRGLPRKQLTPQ